MAVYGKIESFDFEMNWDEYVERVEQYFIANGVEDADKQRSILLTVMGQKMYGLVRNLTSPAKPSAKTYDELKTLISQHLKPKPLIIAERFKFYQRNQHSNETVCQYVAGLRRLSEHCEFGAFLDDALRDRFVSCLSSIPTQRKLLTEATLTMTKAREIAVSMEMAENEARKLKGDRVDKAENVHKFQASKECFRSGKSNHSADRCFYKNSKCHTCKEVGHLHKRCPKSKTSRDKPGNSKNQGTGGTRCNTDSARPTKGDSKKHKKSSKIHFIEDSDQEDVSEVWPIFSIKSTGQKEIRISVDIEKIAQTMELDTGSPVSLISDKDFRAKFQGKFNLQNSSTMLKTYTGEVLPVLGEANIKVSYEGQTKLLPLLVVEGDGPALFGRNWLGQLRLNWKTINMMSINEQKYSVFEDKLGTVKGITASIKLKDNAQPKFFKARTVPYALKDQIGAGLLSLENAGIVEEVDSSEWATPIVPVMKPDGSVRICGDF
ncbi:uncharacterized protein LOC132550276 [Ylistrum balloti]|uniref:uncharacterized protein LOC132550276 n=1 Tax=Ylistrum balloti TaxID=509963 RepID=UPI002905CE60|nr:uncharacterized protein LOC132550276 [Ylistrum balloti]